MRALVLGGYGAISARIVAQLRASGEVAFAAGRDPARADRLVDLGQTGFGSLRAACRMWTSWSTRPAWKSPPWRR